ncbi:hypothetical protein [Streptomyces glaucescens]|uniref:Uncharacterized protein n=1 Tax=Streptomyces glaucescens TaxID=1907 RepID=A0A089X5W5_STRGA|nr:hypothetical protein [Streptomyces glaucescens]AIR96424.1 hypothetical protein SGLAU_01980 [Streptomyces glaucescens]
MTKPDKKHESEIRQAEEERAGSEPFSYPYDERRPNVRAVRHISREEADADSVPGVPGGYGTTGGGQPSRTGSGADEADPDQH